MHQQQRVQGHQELQSVYRCSAATEKAVASAAAALAWQGSHVSVHHAIPTDSQCWWWCRICRALIWSHEDFHHWALGILQPACSPNWTAAAFDYVPRGTRALCVGVPFFFASYTALTLFTRKLNQSHSIRLTIFEWLQLWTIIVGKQRFSFCLIATN